jgi:hypothetical protein
MLVARSWRCSVASLLGSITPRGRRKLAEVKLQHKVPRLGSMAGQLAFFAEGMACAAHKVVTTSRYHMLTLRIDSRSHMPQAS